jgi:hypothetical protein
MFIGKKTHQQSAAIGSLIIIAVFLLSCDNDTGVTPATPNGGPDRYRIETEPTLTPNRNYIYYITTDTSNTAKSGIYRAKAKKPVREEVLLGEGFHSPTLSPDNNTLAFLESAKINYFRLSDQSRWKSSVTDGFESIVFVNDSLLAACRYNSIFLLNENSGIADFFTDGWDPTLVMPDTIVYLIEDTIGSVNTYRIVKNDISNNQPDTILNIGHLELFEFPRWPTLEPLIGRLTYAVRTPIINYVFSAEIGSGVSTHIDTTRYEKPYIINYDLIIFTGPDGRFYQSDFSGEAIFPFWYALMMNPDKE